MLGTRQRRLKPLQPIVSRLLDDPGRRVVRIGQDSLDSRSLKSIGLSLLDELVNGTPSLQVLQQPLLPWIGNSTALSHQPLSF